MNKIPVQKMKFEDQLLEEFINVQESILSAFLLRNLKTNFFRENRVPKDMAKDEDYLKELEKMKKNIRFFLDKKKTEMHSAGEYGYWIDMFLYKIKRLGFLREFDDSSCLRPLRRLRSK